MTDIASSRVLRALLPAAALPALLAACATPPTETADTSASAAPTGTCCLVTEVLVADEEQWFEIANPSSFDVDLDGFRVEGDPGEGFSVTESLTLPARGFVVFASRPTAEVAGEELPIDFIYEPEWLHLQSTNYSLRLYDGDALVDAVGWDATGYDQSSYLDPSATDADDNDDLERWCLSDTIYDNRRRLFGTPGAENPACDGASKVPPELTVDAPHAGDLVINEIAVYNDTYSWFELRNVSERRVDLQGMRLVDGDGTGVVVPEGVSVDAGAMVLFAASGTEATNFWDRATIVPDVSYDLSALHLGHNDDELWIRAGSETVDRVEWFGSDGLDMWDTHSTTLDPAYQDASANDESRRWCVADEVYVNLAGTPYYGSPGQPNGDCP